SLGCPEPKLRADASMATPANAPPPRVSDVSWTSLAMVRTQYTPGFGAVSSGERHHPFWRAGWVTGREVWQSCPAALGQLFPTLCAHLGRVPRAGGGPDGRFAHFVYKGTGSPPSRGTRS